jgi:hypothetical protein
MTLATKVEAAAAKISTMAELFVVLSVQLNPQLRSSGSALVAEVYERVGLVLVPSSPSVQPASTVTALELNFARNAAIPDPAVADANVGAADSPVPALA